jgi:hypothetical protein
MALFGRQIFGILENFLDLVTKFVSGLTGGSSRDLSSKTHDSHYKPSPSTHSPITSNPLIPACLMLIVGYLLITVTPIGTWLTKADGLPTLADFFSFSHKKNVNTLPKASEGISVWTRKQSGFYYCMGDTLFGDEPGELMGQAQALMSGYQPVAGTYCTSNQHTVSSPDSTTVESPQPSGPPDNSMVGEEKSVLVATNQTAETVGPESVSVWGIKPFGLYYCRGDALFGSGPGRMMTQAEALKAGLEPSNHTCSNGRPDQVSEAEPSIESQQLQLPGSAHVFPQETTSSDMPMKDPSPLSKADGTVNVWVIEKFGFYYCQDDVLFGHKPGVLMKQADALTAGYQPSDGQCTKSK